MFKDPNTWDRIIPNATTLLQKIIDSTTIEQLDRIKSNIVSILFYMKKAKEECDNLQIAISISHTSGSISKDELSYQIRNYVTNLDSVLDILQKMICTLNIPNVAFNRKQFKNNPREDYNARINNLRNQLLHKEIPTIEFRRCTEPRGAQCQDIADSFEITEYTEIWIRVKKNWRRLEDYINGTYNPTVKLLTRSFDLIIESLG